MKEFPKPPMHDTIESEATSESHHSSSRTASRGGIPPRMSIPTGPTPEAQTDTTHTEVENPPDKTSYDNSREELAFIFRTTLKPHHRSNPYVIKFINAYLHCRDVKQAADEAGIGRGVAKRLRAEKDVHACISAITQHEVMKFGYDAHEVVAKVMDIASVDPIVFENEDGSFKESMSQIPAEARRAIKKFKCKNLYDYDSNGIRTCVGKLIEVELWDKMKSIEMLGREKGIFKETHVVEHDVTRDMKKILLASRERAEKAALESREAREVKAIEVKAIDVEVVSEKKS